MLEIYSMTQNEKQILMIDLCGRLSYGVKCIGITPLEQFQDKNLWEIDRVRADVMELGMSNCYVCYGNYVNIHNIKPYLRPMSSMTGVEVLEYLSLKESITASDDIDYHFETYESIDWLNKNHFDYRGLIEKGLAIDATGKNIY